MTGFIKYIVQMNDSCVFGKFGEIFFFMPVPQNVRVGQIENGGVSILLTCYCDDCQGFVYSGNVSFSKEIDPDHVSYDTETKQLFVSPNVEKEVEFFSVKIEIDHWDPVLETLMIKLFTS